MVIGSRSTKRLGAFGVPVLAVVLIACGAGSGPASATREWMDAFAALDGNRAASLTCDAMQESLMMGGGILTVAQLFTGGVLGFGADIDVSDLEYEVVSQRGDEAVVRMNGTMRVAILGVSQGEDIDERLRVVREDGEWKVCQ